MRCLVAFALLLALLVPTPQAAAARLEDKLHQRKAQAKRIERELKVKRQAIARVDRQQKSTAGELRALEKELAAQQRRLADLEDQRRSCEADYARTQAELAELLPQVGRLRQSLGGCVALLADVEPQGECAALFAPEHPSRLAETSLYLERLVQAEARTIEAREADAERLRASQARAEAERQRLESLTERVAQQRQAIERKQAEKARLLASLGREKQSYTQATRRLEESQRALRGLIDDLEQKLAAATAARNKPEPGRPAPPPPQATTGFAALRGRLPQPLAGKVVGRFGQRDSQGIAATGIDIAAPGGTPFGCVWRGRVAYAGMLKGYGNLIVVDHGEGYYSLYGRAARLSRGEGQSVERGDVLGAVAEGASALYFEIRHHRTPQDPMAWLGGAVAINNRR